MATFEEGFLYPLILLLVGAGITSVLIPWFAKRSENRKKALEIKLDIASKMSEVVAYQTVNSRALATRTRSKYNESDIDAYRKSVNQWYIDVNIINLKLNSYFAGTGIGKKWWDYWRVWLSYANASRLYPHDDLPELQKEQLKKSLEKIREYFPNSTDIDWNRLTTELTYDDDQWTNISAELMVQGDNIIKELLGLPIKAF